MCNVYYLTPKQARRFLLLKHGLLGAKKFSGKTGVLDFIKQAGCIQFYPIDICGKNAELTLQSRVKGFSKSMLYELLYQDRKLVDYPDKNLSIFAVEDWPYFARYREAAKESGKQFAGMETLKAYVKDYIEENGPVSSDTLPVNGQLYWHSAIHWSGNWHGQTSAARAVLEQLYSTGELVIHHREGVRKFYDLSFRHINTELLSMPDPFPEEEAHIKWRLYRRIGAVGLMWNRPSDAWLNIWGMRAAQRAAAFQVLLDEGKLLKIEVQGIKETLFCQSTDLDLLKAACSERRFSKQCVLMAPLDPLLWDRRLIDSLFGFRYKWEIYTPVEQRKFGYYTLPVLYGEEFFGRVEIVRESGTNSLEIRHFWPEKKLTSTFCKAFEQCLRRFAKFNTCENIVWM